jgi:Cof subfamily protein (haloacid dehalogenase superfamily)
VDYKLLALDVDGTLLRRDGTIHPGDRDAITRLRASGVPITIVTGRLYSGTSGVARSIQITGPIACVDGSHIVDLDDDTSLFCQTIMGDDAASLRDVIERHPSASFLFANDNIVHDVSGEPFAPYVRTWSPNIAVVDRVTDHPYWAHERGVVAVVSVGQSAHIDAAALELRERLDHAAFVISFPIGRMEGMAAMVIRAKGPTKGTAIGWLADYYGCNPAQVVAVGDWLNDVPMFQAAGRSFVMGQAPAHVKAEATDQLVADGHEGGGIAEAIERAFDL